MKCDVFVKSCFSQLHWLAYSLQLLQKNWQSDGEFVVMVDVDCYPVVKEWGIPRARYLLSEPWRDGYMHALYQKATADFYSKTDPILLIDSDTMLAAPAGVENFMSEGKLVLEYLPWDDVETDLGRQCARRIWPRVVKESTGLELEVDYMVSRPWIFWRSTFAGARSLVEVYKEKPFRDAVYSSQPYDWTQYEHHPFSFCDLETLGLFAAKRESDRYVLKRKEGESLPFLDFWSNTEFTSEVRAKLDALLRV